jgi:hypothetical protein
MKSTRLGTYKLLEDETKAIRNLQKRYSIIGTSIADALGKNASYYSNFLNEKTGLSAKEMRL